MRPCSLRLRQQRASGRVLVFPPRLPFNSYVLFFLYSIPLNFLDSVRFLLFNFFVDCTRQLPIDMSLNSVTGRQQSICPGFGYARLRQLSAMEIVDSFGIVPKDPFGVLPAKCSWDLVLRAARHLLPRPGQLLADDAEHSSVGRHKESLGGGDCRFLGQH